MVVAPQGRTKHHGKATHTGYATPDTNLGDWVFGHADKSEFGKIVGASLVHFALTYILAEDVIFVCQFSEACELDWPECDAFGELNHQQSILCLVSNCWFLWTTDRKNRKRSKSPTFVPL